MLPLVIKKFQTIVNMKNEVVRIQSDLENNPKYMDTFKDYIIKKQELNTAITNFYKSIEDLEATGVSVKSIDQGLLDFPSLMFNEEIWLCWKQGETESPSDRERPSRGLAGLFLDLRLVFLDIDKLGDNQQKGNHQNNERHNNSEYPFDSFHGSPPGIKS